MQLKPVRRGEGFVYGGADSGDDDVDADFARLGVGGLRRKGRRPLVDVSTVSSRMTFVSGGMQGGTIDDWRVQHLAPAAAAELDGDESDARDDDEDSDGGEEHGEEDEEADGEAGDLAEDEDAVDEERYSLADMHKILAMDLGDGGRADESSDDDDDGDVYDDDDESDSDDSEGSGSSDDSDASDDTDTDSDEDSDEIDDILARAEEREGFAARGADAADGGAPRAPPLRAATAPSSGPAQPAALSATQLLELLAAQPALLSLTLRRPAKGELGALAWRADELDVEIISEGSAIVLTKCGPGAGGGRGSAGRAGAARARGSAVELDAADRLLADFHGLGGKKKTMPKHLKKQLKAARRIRTQELDFAAQRRLMAEVLALSGGMRGAGRAHTEPRATKRGAHFPPSGKKGKGKGGGFRAATAEHDPATRLTTTRNLAALGEDNKGHQLLTMMGWAGGGLGAAGEGLATPLTVDMRSGRKGLGHDSKSVSAINPAER
jgi:hypothetical protein